MTRVLGQVPVRLDQILERRDGAAQGFDDALTRGLDSLGGFPVHANIVTTGTP